MNNTSHDTTLDRRRTRENRAGESCLDHFFRRQVLAVAARVEVGQVRVIDGSNEFILGQSDPEPHYRATIWVHHPRFYRMLALNGSLGAGEAFMEGLWACDNLTGLIRIFARNRRLLERIDNRLTRLFTPLKRLSHQFSRNTRGGSRRNIEYHYDLGNEFFASFLDETMMYSCACFEDESTSLRDASIAKIDRICRKLRLRPDDHLLEIGTGWGGFAVHAARNYGCRVTTTTISAEQYALAEQRIREAGVADRVKLLLEDYRDLEGAFDKLVSIEMVEAVGLDFLETYFAKCSSLLKPDGLMLIQAITIADEFFEQARRSVDFIQRYIFPGSAVPSLSRLCRATAASTDLQLIDLEDITHHYATTLERWRERFLANIASVRALGYPERFVRMWEFYLCYCEGGFRERYIGDVQLLYAKPLWRPL